jgi:hypothetical protein
MSEIQSAVEDPQALLERLCAGAHPRKACSLRLIYTICQEQHRQGSKDFSIATIGRLSGERSGPKAQAIRNETGADYRLLIQAFARQTGGHDRKVAQVPVSQDEALLRDITDPVVRARLRLLLAERSGLLRQVNLLRNHLREAVVVDKRREPAAIVPADRLDNVPPSNQSMVVEVQSPPLALTETELDTLEQAISPETFRDWGWVADRRGRVSTINGAPVFERGFVSAIAKVLKAAGRDAVLDREISKGTTDRNDTNKQ